MTLAADLRALADRLSDPTSWSPAVDGYASQKLRVAGVSVRMLEVAGDHDDGARYLAMRDALDRTLGRRFFAWEREAGRTHAEVLDLVRRAA